MCQHTKWCVGRSLDLSGELHGEDRGPHKEYRNLTVFTSGEKREAWCLRVFFPKQQINFSNNCKLARTMWNAQKLLWKGHRETITPAHGDWHPPLLGVFASTILCHWLLMVCKDVTYQRLLFIFEASCWWSEGLCSFHAVDGLYPLAPSIGRISERVYVKILTGNSVFPACLLKS